MDLKAKVIVPAFFALLMFGILPAGATAAVKLGKVAPFGTATGSCDYCTWVQRSMAGPDHYAAAPLNGVITSYRVRAGTNVGSHYHDLATFRRLSQTDYAAVWSSSSSQIFESQEGQLVEFKVAIPMAQGELIGIRIGQWGGNNTAAIHGTGVNGDDVRALTGVSPNYEDADLELTDGWAANIEATLEPDADGDSLGDETQDLCPTSKVPAPCSKVGPDTTPFEIWGLAMAKKTFRVNRNGPVISAKTSVGAKIVLEVSQASTANLAVARILPGRRVGKSCVRPKRSNAKRRSCTRTMPVHQFSRTLRGGVNRFVYSGRFMSGGAARTLVAGNYRITAVATNPSGSTAPKSAFFTVIK